MLIRNHKVPVQCNALSGRDRVNMNQNKMMSYAARLQIVSLSMIYFISMPTGEAAAAPIHRAVRDNDIESLRKLLRTTDARAANAVVEQSVTALHIAAALNRGEAAEILIQNGADVNARSEGGFSPLHWAARSDAVDVITRLVSSGVDINTEAKGGITALHWAANRNATNAISALIASGANVYQLSDRGAIALRWAVRNNCLEAAKLIADKMVTDNLKNTPVASDANNSSDGPDILPTSLSGVEIAHD